MVAGSQEREQVAGDQHRAGHVHLEDRIEHLCIEVEWTTVVLRSPEAARIRPGGVDEQIDCIGFVTDSLAASTIEDSLDRAR